MNIDLISSILTAFCVSCILKADHIKQATEIFETELTFLFDLIFNENYKIQSLAESQNRYTRLISQENVSILRFVIYIFYVFKSYKNVRFKKRRRGLPLNPVIIW